VNEQIGLTRNGRDLASAHDDSYVTCGVTETTSDQSGGSEARVCGECDDGDVCRRDSHVV
jgi:hypothetical protein